MGRGQLGMPGSRPLLPGAAPEVLAGLADLSPPTLTPSLVLTRTCWPAPPSLPLPPTGCFTIHCAAIYTYNVLGINSQGGPNATFSQLGVLLTGKRVGGWVG